MKRASKLFVISLVAICMGAVINNQEGGASVGDTILSLTSAVIAGAVAKKRNRDKVYLATKKRLCQSTQPPDI